MTLLAPLAAIFNIGSGHSVSVAGGFASAMGRPNLSPVFMDKARAGDIRHCFADIALAQCRLAFAPRRSFADSFDKVVDWVPRQQSVDRFTEARLELEQRGLVA